MQITQSGPFSQPVYQNFLVAVSNGFVYYGQSSTALTLAGNQSTAPLVAGTNVSMAFLNLKVYIVDGTSIVQLNLTTGNIETYSATTGTAPTNCSLCVNWRGRLVLAGDANNPQNYYMSRAGTPTDWDYSQTDPAAAVAGNLGTSGKIGEPITCMIPFTDDLMKFGCVNSLWMMQGDPADGGSLVKVSDKMGIVGKDAWCVDPAGTLYFVATGGLYSVRPQWEFYRPPELMTGQNYDQFFAGLSWGVQNITLVWDEDHKYLQLFVSPVGGSQGTHLILDSRGEFAIWPQQFPASQGPACAIRFLGDASSTGRVTLLGGQDGYIRLLDFAATDDDGTATSAYVVLGPFKPMPEAAILTGVTINLGEVPSTIAGTPTYQYTSTITSTSGGGSSDTLVANPPPSGNGFDFQFSQIPLVASTTTVFVNGSTIPFNSTGSGAGQFWYFEDGSTSGITTGLTPTLWMETNQLIVGPPYNVTANYTYSGGSFGGGGTSTTFTSTITVIGTNPWNAQATIYTAPDAYEVTEGVASNTHGFSSVQMYLERRQKTFRHRLRGGWFSLKLSNTIDGDFFSFESATLEFQPGGKLREYR